MNIKDEFIKRYKYIYENAAYILAPLMAKETENEKDPKKEYCFSKDEKNLVSDAFRIDLKPLPKELILSLESFLLSDICFQESDLFKNLETLKKDPQYIEKVENGLNLLKEKNSNLPNIMQEKLDAETIFHILYCFEKIMLAYSFTAPRIKHLHVIEEYWKTNLYDNSEMPKNFISNSIKQEYDKHYEYFNIGIEEYLNIKILESTFLNNISNTKNNNLYNSSFLSEEENQKIYLTYHDELPWNTEKTCVLEENNLPILIETRLIRPEHTNPCGNKFYIKENQIFINPSDKLYRYYQMCPNCGYIVNIPENILSESMKTRIKKRCEQDPYLFRKMLLKSELKALENQGKKLERKLK